MSIFLFHFLAIWQKIAYMSVVCGYVSLGLCVCMCVAGLWAIKVGDAMS